MTQDYNEPGRISLFHNEGNGKGPDHTGYAIAHRDIKAGEKVAISLWAKDKGTLSLSGKLSDYQAKAKPKSYGF